MAYRAAMALGPLAPLLRCPDMWRLVEGLDEPDPVLDLRLGELDLRTGPPRRREGPRAAAMTAAPDGCPYWAG